jgi:hypothetical protein|tara:strand:- start:6505 stop:6705 length:201 start_codon:yes stop_codon:yes gene_type:complete
MGSKGSKTQRQNKYMTKLMSKIRKFDKKGKSTAGLKRELAYLTGEIERPEFKTGAAADSRGKKYSG